MPSSFVRIETRERLYQEIVDQIQDQVVSGELRPGDRLPAERELAERFGVSRTAVREAIKSLAERGIIEVLVGRGTFVRSVPIEHVVESMLLLLRERRAASAHVDEVRALLDIEVARLAARHRTPEDVERLAAVLRTMAEVRHSERGVAEADASFFDELARATGNPVLDVLSRSVARMYQSRTTQSPRGGTLAAAVLERRQRLLRAVDGQQVDEAARVMAEIISNRTRRG
jgi:GntR family transcriptional regulator, transcriptional repressor for pyruvate dehydrogenase complex